MLRMSDAPIIPLSGHCLCGAVTFTATPAKLEMGACHCGMCRRWSGGSFLAVGCGASVSVEDESQLGVYKSSPYGERCFCKTCGTTLFWRMQAGGMTVVAAQAFDEPSQFKFVSEIYSDAKPDNYAFADEGSRKHLTEEEFLAAFMAGQSDH
jgi:hypothetical protein